MATKKEKKRIANARRKQAKIDRWFYDRLSEPCEEHNDKNCNNFNCYMIDQKKIHWDNTRFIWPIDKDGNTEV